MTFEYTYHIIIKYKKIRTNLVAKMQYTQATGNILVLFFFWPTLKLNTNQSYAYYDNFYMKQK